MGTELPTKQGRTRSYRTTLILTTWPFPAPGRAAANLNQELAKTSLGLTQSYLGTLVDMEKFVLCKLHRKLRNSTGSSVRHNRMRLTYFQGEDASQSWDTRSYLLYLTQHDFRAAGVTIWSLLGSNCEPHRHCLSLCLFVLWFKQQKLNLLCSGLMY